MKREQLTTGRIDGQQPEIYADVIDASGQAAIVVNHGAFLLTADYVRSGPDLILVGKDGTKVLVTGFFDNEFPPDLLTLGGARVEGELANLLAGPRAGGFAQADDTTAEPIGVVEQLDGTVFATRVDGGRVQLNAGDPVFQDDVIETDGEGSVGLRFIDETTFSIGEDARMVLDDFVYDPAANTGNAVVSVLQGSFSFVSGAVAKTGDDALTVKTPVLTIGIRGTYVTGQGGQEGEKTEVVNLPDDNGNVGSIFTSNDAGSALLNQAYQGTETTSRFEAPSTPRIYQLDEVQQKFGNALNFLPESPDVRGGSGERQQGDENRDDAGGNGADGEAAGEGDGEDEGETGAGEEEAEEEGDGEEETEGEEEAVDESGDEAEDGGPDSGADDGGSDGGDAEAAAPAAPAPGPGSGPAAPPAGGPSFTESLGEVLDSANTPDGGGAGGAGGGTGGGSAEQPEDDNEEEVVVEEEVEEEVNNDGDQAFAGTDGDDEISGGGGNDTITGGDGNDTLNGDDGNDIVSGQNGNDSLSGGNGNDTLSGGQGNDTLSGGDGTDTADFSGTDGGVTVNLTNGTAVDGTDNNDVLNGIEVVVGSAFLDNLIGSANADQLSGGGGGDTLVGNDGNDTLDGGDGNDNIQGGNGADSIIAGTGNDLADGGAGADTMVGAAGNDSLNGGADADDISGGDGDDLLDGGAGADVITGDAGNDTLQGGADNDTMDGGDGADSFDGGAGTDSINGGAGNDTIDGGDGADTLTGGAGDDLYVFRSTAGVAETVVPGADPAAVRSAIVDDDVFLEGTFISVGVSGGGSFGTANAAPAGFHPLFRTQLGMTADQDGFDIGADPTTGDFFLPGSPEESFTVGYQRLGTNFNFTNAERSGVTDLTQQNVANQSAGGQLQALWEGVTNGDGGRLEVDQVVTFNETDKFFQNTITLTNVGSEAINSVRYMRSFDPDQDADVGGGFATINTIVNQPGDGGADNLAIVSATGQQSNVPLFFLADAANARVGNFGFSNRDVFAAAAFDGAAAEGTTATSDSAITITFDVGTLAAGASQTVTYFTSLDQNLEASIEAITNAFDDTIVEAAGGGTDTVQSDVGVTLADNVENLQLVGNDNIDGVGNAETNQMTGNSGNNVLQGLAANDSLIGGSGNDTLDGGDGDDVITGGIGADDLRGGTGSDDFLYVAANDGTAVALNQTVAAAGVAVDLINDFQTGVDEFIFDQTSGDFNVATLTVIGAGYDGTNSGLEAGESLIFDGTHLIHDADVNAAGYTVIAQVQGDAVAAGDIRLQAAAG